MKDSPRFQNLGRSSNSGKRLQESMSVAASSDEIEGSSQYMERPIGRKKAKKEVKAEHFSDRSRAFTDITNIFTELKGQMDAFIARTSITQNIFILNCDNVPKEFKEDALVELSNLRKRNLWQLNENTSSQTPKQTNAEIEIDCESESEKDDSLDLTYSYV